MFECVECFGHNLRQVLEVRALVSLAFQQFGGLCQFFYFDSSGGLDNKCSQYINFKKMKVFTYSKANTTAFIHDMSCNFLMLDFIII